MKTECEKCGARFNLPDAKLKPGTDFSFACSKCKHKITISVPARRAVGYAENGDQDNDEADIFAGDFFEEGAKPALICFDESPTRDHLAKIVEHLGYVPVLPSSLGEALQKLKITKFSLILVNQNFAGQSMENNAILKMIQPMEMTSRRQMFVALFGPNYKTLDNMIAYSLSVNAVINLNEEAQFNKALRRSISEYERFYKVFFDIMREMGKI